MSGSVASTRSTGLGGASLSGQQVGTVVGGVVGAFVGFFAGGNVALGWQIGAAAGGAIGGYLDPEVIKGPKLTDPQKQTSAEGVPRNIVYGTAAVMSNVIQVQSVPTQHKKKKRTGKGGNTVQETYTYTRTAAFRISEAAPLGGEMMLRRVWMNGKLALDRTGTGDIDAESAKLMGELTFYSGAENQLPDPDLEALPTVDGGGVGNVPAYVGTCYVVLRNVDVTNGGALPQFMWEVSSEATEEGGVTPWIAKTAGSGIKGSPDGLDWTAASTTNTLAEGGTWTPAASTEMVYAGGDVLGISSTSGVFGSESSAFRDSDGIWHQISMPAGLSSGSGQVAYSGTHWFVAAKSPGPCKVSTDGLTFTDIVYSFEDFALLGDKMIGVYATGASLDIVTMRMLHLDGTDAGALTALHTVYIARDAVIDSDGSTGLMALTDETASGGTTVRVNLHSMNYQCVTWTDHGYFIEFPTALTNPKKVH